MPTKRENYIASCRLEGLELTSPDAPTYGMNKEELIEYYTELGKNQTPLPEEFNQIVNDNFWDLVDGDIDESRRNK